MSHRPTAFPSPQSPFPTPQSLSSAAPTLHRHPPSPPQTRCAHQTAPKSAPPRQPPPTFPQSAATRTVTPAAPESRDSLQPPPAIPRLPRKHPPPLSSSDPASSPREYSAPTQSLPAKMQLRVPPEYLASRSQPPETHPAQSISPSPAAATDA